MDEVEIQALERETLSELEQRLFVWNGENDRVRTSGSRSSLSCCVADHRCSGPNREVAAHHDRVVDRGLLVRFFAARDALRVKLGR